MKVFVTGASGFIGAAVVDELIASGHQVLGLARSRQSAKRIKEAGAEVIKGNLEDIESLKQGALQADGIIHTAFFHDFTQYNKAAVLDREAINAMGEVLINTTKPMVVTAGLLGLPLINGFVTEQSIAQYSLRFSEATALSLAERGVNASVVRLAPSVHDKNDKGFVPFIISLAAKNKLSAYPGDGTNQWPAIHRLDAAKLFQLALEKGNKGALYNGAGETGIEVKEIAALIGEKLNLHTASLPEDEVGKHFEWMGNFIRFDNPTSTQQTQEALGWKPKHIGLLEDMRQNYF